MGRWKGTCFVYDSVNSNTKNVMIGTLDGNAITTSDVLGKYESYIDKTNRLDTFYNMGGIYTSPPQNEFNIVVTKKDITMTEIADIYNWLFNRKTFLQLEILQDDMTGYVYYCKLLNPQLTSVAGFSVAWTCTMECNSAYIWKKNGKLYNITNTTPIMVNNESMENEYIYPNIEIKSSIDNGTVRITNNTLGEYFEIQHLALNEVININKMHIISTSLGNGINKIKDTNKKFLKLKQGNNTITVTGNFAYVKISYDEALKAGG